MEAYLALEDGTIFKGTAFGALGTKQGEVVFNTSMIGYQEILTDPSYCGQIVTLTYPMIGNYGVNQEDYESKKPHVQAFVVRENCDFPSNWRQEKSLSQFLEEYGIVAIAGIDTRKLTRILRTRGTMQGVVSSESLDRDRLLQLAKEQSEISGSKLVPMVTTENIYTIEGNGKHVVLLDFGAKANILRSLQKMHCKITVVPANTGAEEILALQPDGVLLSNGPGDPKDVPYAIATIKKLLGQIPIFGICLGHQLLALAVGGDTYKLPFGHRGGNHPVQEIATGKVQITSQNHGYAVQRESLDVEKVEVTHININDQTVEGIRLKDNSAFSVQYHPESSPGPKDSEFLFQRFAALMQDFNKKEVHQNA